MVCLGLECEERKRGNVKKRTAEFIESFLDPTAKRKLKKMPLFEYREIRSLRK
jgi:hypothetical protein